MIQCVAVFEMKFYTLLESKGGKELSMECK